MSSPLVDAWQQALAAEHAAVFGYATLGPYLGADAELGQACTQAHEALRDQTTAALLRAGQTPVSTRADYPLPLPLRAGADTQRFALQLEEAGASAWRFLLARAAGPPDVTAGLSAAALGAVRTSAQTALVATAVRAVQWRRLVSPGSPSVPFPGI